MSDEIIFSASGRSDRVIGRNDSNADMEIGFPVRFSEPIRKWKTPEHPARVPLGIEPVTRETSVIGVTLNRIPRGGYGEVLVQGVAPCRINRIVRSQFVLTGDGEMVPASHGWPLLAMESDGSALILLDGNHQNYCGPFAVVGYDGSYFCRDTAHPDSEIAGDSDLGPVPAGSISPVGGQFMLYAWYADGEYHQSFSPPGNVSSGMVCLADLVDGVPWQRWTQGPIHWSQWYLL